MLLKWNKLYSVNVKEIDDQHKKIFEIINRLYHVHKNIDKGDLEEILNELENYAKYHFSTEEKYFNKFSYSDKENHIKTHEWYIQKIAEFKKRNINTIMNDLLKFLRDWWLGHVQAVDIKYSDFFNQHGLF